MRIQSFSSKGRRLYDLRTLDGDLAARFASIEQAALVARYVSGAEMDTDERQRATAALRAVDAADAEWQREREREREKRRERWAAGQAKRKAALCAGEQAKNSENDDRPVCGA